MPKSGPSSPRSHRSSSSTGVFSPGGKSPKRKSSKGSSSSSPKLNVHVPSPIREVLSADNFALSSDEDTLSMGASSPRLSSMTYESALHEIPTSPRGRIPSKGSSIRSSGSPIRVSSVAVTKRMKDLESCISKLSTELVGNGNGLKQIMAKNSYLHQSRDMGKLRKGHENLVERVKRTEKYRVRVDEAVVKHLAKLQERLNLAIGRERQMQAQLEDLGKATHRAGEASTRQVHDLQTDIESLKEERKKAEREAEELKVVIGRQADELEGSARKTMELEAKCADLEKKLKKGVKLTEDTLKHVSKSDERAATLQRRLDDSKEANAKLKQEMITLRSMHENERDKLRAEKNRAVATLEKEQEELSRVERRIQREKESLLQQVEENRRTYEKSAKDDLKVEVERARREGRAVMEEMERKLERREAEYKDSMTRAKKDHATERSEVAKKHSQEISRLKVAHKNDLSTLRSELENDKKAQMKSFEVTLGRIRTEKVEVDARLNSSADAHKRELSRMRDARDSELANLRKEYDEKLREISRGHKREVDALREAASRSAKEHSRELESLRMSNLSEIRKVEASLSGEKSSHLDAMSNLKEESQKRISSLEAKVQAMEKENVKLTAERAELRASVKTLQSLEERHAGEVTTLRRKMTDIEGQLETEKLRFHKAEVESQASLHNLKSEVAKMTQSRSSLEDKLSDTQNALERADKTIQTLRAKAESVQGEKERVITATSDEISRLKADLAKVHNKQESITSSAQSERERVARLEREISVLDQDRQKLQEQLRNERAMREEGSRDWQDRFDKAQRHAMKESEDVAREHQEGVAHMERAHKAAVMELEEEYGKQRRELKLEMSRQVDEAVAKERRKAVSEIELLRTESREEIGRAFDHFQREMERCEKEMESARAAHEKNLNALESRLATEKGRVSIVKDRCNKLAAEMRERSAQGETLLQESQKMGEVRLEEAERRILELQVSMAKWKQMASSSREKIQELETEKDRLVEELARATDRLKHEVEATIERGKMDLGEREKEFAESIRKMEDEWQAVEAAREREMTRLRSSNKEMEDQILSMREKYENKYRERAEGDLLRVNREWEIKADELKRAAKLNVEELNDKIRDLERAVKSAREHEKDTVLRMEKELSEMCMDYKKKLEVSREKADELASIAQRLKDEFERERSRADNLEAKLEEAKTSSSLLEEASHELSKARTRYQNAERALSEIRDLEGEINSLKQDIDESQDEKVALSTELSKAKMDLDEQREVVSGLREDVNQREDEIRALEKEVSRLHEVAAEQEKLQQQERDTLIREADALKGDLNHCHLKVQVCEESTARVDQERLVCLEQLESTRCQLDEAQADVVRLNAQIKAADEDSKHMIGVLQSQANNITSNVETTIKRFVEEQHREVSSIQAEVDECANAGTTADLMRDFIQSKTQAHEASLAPLGGDAGRTDDLSQINYLLSKYAFGGDKPVVLEHQGGHRYDPNISAAARAALGSAYFSQS